MYKALSVRCQRCTKKKKNEKKIMLCCIVIGACAVQFLHYVTLYRNIQHYATLNCSIKSRLCAGGTYTRFQEIFVFQNTFTLLWLQQKFCSLYLRSQVSLNGGKACLNKQLHSSEIFFGHLPFTLTLFISDLLPLTSWVLNNINCILISPLFNSKKYFPYQIYYNKHPEQGE